MKRPGGDGSSSGGALIPATGSMVSNNWNSGYKPGWDKPHAYDGRRWIFFYQPVQAYFQFVQNNLKYINESNIDNIRQEAGGIAK